MRMGLFASSAPEVEEPEGSDDDGSFQGDTDEGVSPASMMLERGDWAVGRPEDVEVGDLGGNDHGCGGVRGFAVEASAGEAASGQEVSYWFH